jgi:hypothetical protein
MLAIAGMAGVAASFFGAGGWLFVSGVRWLQSPAWPAPALLLLFLGGAWPMRAKAGVAVAGVVAAGL